MGNTAVTPAAYSSVISPSAPPSATGRETISLLLKILFILSEISSQIRAEESVPLKESGIRINLCILSLYRYRAVRIIYEQVFVFIKQILILEILFFITKRQADKHLFFLFKIIALYMIKVNQNSLGGVFYAENGKKQL